MRRQVPGRAPEFIGTGGLHDTLALTFAENRKSAFPSGTPRVRAAGPAVRK